MSNGNATPKINIRAGDEIYNGKSDAELRALVETKKSELEAVVPPNNQHGMPVYHSGRDAIFSDLARLYRKLVMTEAADLADASAKAERKAGKSWQRALNGEANSNSEAEGGGRRRALSKKRKTMKKRSPRTNKKMKFMASWYKSLF
jgi:hypothetical protein